jgi:hypothetical protein
MRLFFSLKTENFIWKKEKQYRVKNIVKSWAWMAHILTVATQEDCSWKSALVGK